MKLKDLLLDGFVVYSEFLRIYLNRIEYCKCYEECGFVCDEVSGFKFEIKCFGVWKVWKGFNMLVFCNMWLDKMVY